MRMPPLTAPVTTLPNDNPQHEIHNHNRSQRNRQHRRAESIVKPAHNPRAGTPSPYPLSTPMEHDQRVQHGRHCDESEEAGGDLADAVAEVEQADGEAAEDDGEVQPGEKGAFVCEEDFGFDAGGQGDAFACFGRGMEMG